MVALANTAEILEAAHANVRSEIERWKEDPEETKKNSAVDEPSSILAKERLWLPYRYEKKGAHVRLFLFHWAGASASAYSTWESLASEDVEVCAVQMPGREDFDISHIKQDAREATMVDLADQFIDDVEHLFAGDGMKPVFFAHGTGSWFAFEVARKLEVKKKEKRKQLRRPCLHPPAAFFVSCFPAPDIPMGERPWPAFNTLKKSEFVREMCQTWSVPVIALRAPALDTFYKCLKRDFHVMDQYFVDPNLAAESRFENGETSASRSSPLLSCPVSLFLALDDPFVGPNKGAPVLMEAWGKFTSADHMSVDIFHGDHYYLRDIKMQDSVGKVLMKKVQEIADLLSFEM